MLTYGRVSMGAGMLFADGTDPLKTRDPQIIRDVTAGLVGTAQVLFGYESADLDLPDAGRVTTGRTRCEMALAGPRADHRTWSRHRGDRHDITEGTRQHNDGLSLNRARAVSQAMSDAFGALITGVPALHGLGEKPAVLSGLYLVRRRDARRWWPAGSRGRAVPGPGGVFRLSRRCDQCPVAGVAPGRHRRRRRLHHPLPRGGPGSLTVPAGPPPNYGAQPRADVDIVRPMQRFGARYRPAPGGVGV